jgi:hypothetical protein
MGNTCRQYGSCKAPICAKDNSFNTAVWYPGEDICISREYGNSPWRIKQKRIKSLNMKTKVEGLFTVEWLRSIKKIQRGIKGLPSEGLYTSTVE